MDVLERFLTYARIDTASSDESETSPTTPGQWDLARRLAADMEAIGFEKVRLAEGCYVYGELPATPGWENRARLGFIAHMDTAPDFAGTGVEPQVILSYDGGPVRLGASGLVLSPGQFPHLPSLAGRCLVTTDGTTLLGADDKAGVAEILDACASLLADGEVHGRIAVAFTPDEEVGLGPNGFDLAAFGCDFAYTLDGGPEGEIEYENFNGCDASFRIRGRSVHPGSAKDIMVNAAKVACEIQGMVPAGESPRDTEGYEGFYHLTRLSGTVEEAAMDFIVRDHDRELFEERKRRLAEIRDAIDARYGEGTATLTVTDRYYNMIEKIRPHFHLVENAREATRAAGLAPIVQPIRGGTDGARLSYMGLPCPNLGTGGYGYHGPYEHITREGMEAAVAVIRNLIRLYAGLGPDGASV